MSSSALDPIEAPKAVPTQKPAPVAVTRVTIDHTTPTLSLPFKGGHWRLWLETPPGQWCEGRISADALGCTIAVDQDVWLYTPSPATLTVTLNLGAICRLAVQQRAPGIATAKTFAAKLLKLLAASPRRFLRTARAWRPTQPIVIPIATDGPKIWFRDAIDPRMADALMAQGCTPDEAARAAEAFADPAIDCVSFDGIPETPLPPPDPILLETFDPYAAVRFIRPGLTNVDARRALEHGHWLHLCEPMRRARTPWPQAPGRLPTSAAKDINRDVAVIIPTRDRPDLLGPCLAGLARTVPPPREIVLVDHATTDAQALTILNHAHRDGAIVVRDTGPFNFSRLINLGVHASSASVLCFLNNDVTPIDTDWLAALFNDAIRPDIGVVAPQLLFPDGSIQHVGIAGYRDTGFRHICENWRAGSDDPAGILRARRSVTAVTGACIVTRRSIFQALGGLDEKFPSDFNDIDYCLRSWAKGWKVIVNPAVRLTHLQSATRALTRHNRRIGEAVMAARHADWPTLDPHQSPRMERLPPSIATRRARPG